MSIKKDTPEYWEAKKFAIQLNRDGVCNREVMRQTGFERNQLAGILHRAIPKPPRLVVHINPSPPPTPKQKDEKKEVKLENLVKGRWKPKGEDRPFLQQRSADQERFARHARKYISRFCRTSDSEAS